MTFKLYLELASRRQDDVLVDLLRFPGEPALSEGAWSARWWSDGRTRRKSAPDREVILAEIKESGCNELTLSWRAASGTPSMPMAAQLLGLEIQFSPSFTSSLWASVPTRQLKSRQDERIRRTFSAADSAPGQILAFPSAAKAKLPAPSLLECSFELQCDTKDLGEGDLQKRAIDWIRFAVPRSFDALDAFGYGCVHERCRRMNMAASMGGVSTWSDQLGERFENIYPILVGGTELCLRVKSGLGEGCSLIDIPNQPGTAIVSIAPEDISEIRQEPKAKDWVVIRDLSALNAPAATLDEMYKRSAAVPALAPFYKR